MPTAAPMAVLAFLVGAAYWPGIPSAAFAPRWWVLAAGLAVVSALDPRRLDPAVGACLALAVVSAIAGLAGLPFGYGLFDLMMIVLFALTMLAAAALDDVGPPLAALCIAVSISSALAVAQSLGWSPVPQAVAPAGTFFNREALAEIAAPLAAWALWSAAGATDRRLRAWRFALAALMVPPILLCGSRIAWLALAAGLVFGLAARLRALAAAALAASAAAVVLLAGIDKLGSAVHRVVLWGAGAMLVTPFGRGLGWWDATHPGPFEQFAHSDALQAVVELGVGAAFFLAIPVLIIVRGDRSHAERAAFVALCVEAVVSFPLHLPATGFLAALLAGFLARDRSLARDVRPRRGAAGVGAFLRAHLGLGRARGGRRGGPGVPDRPSAGALARAGAAPGGAMTR